MTESRPTSRSICLLTNTYPEFPESNHVVFMRDLSRLLSERGWGVLVVAPHIYPESRREEREGAVEIRRFESFLGGKLLIEYGRTPVFRLLGYMLFGLIAAIRQARRCDLIHAHWVIPAGLIGLIAGRICRKPVIVTAHGSDILVIPRRNALLKKLAKLVLERADAVTSVAQHVTGEMQRMGIRVNNIVTFPMSVPVETFAPEDEHVENCGAQVVFSNRRLYPLYDVQLLVQAAPSIIEKDPGIKMLIAGKGPEQQALRSLADTLGVSESVEFLGEISHEQMPKYLRSATVYISTAHSDGASVSLLEAMACGTVPIVTDIAANREWIRDGENGFLFPPGDAKALAEKVGDCLRQPDVRRKAREINIQTVRQRAQWNLNVDKLLNLYEKTMPRQ